MWQIWLKQKRRVGVLLLQCRNGRQSCDSGTRRFSTAGRVESYLRLVCSEASGSWGMSFCILPFHLQKGKMESSSAGNSFPTPSVVFLCDSAKRSNFTTLWKFQKLAPEKLAGPQKGSRIVFQLPTIISFRGKLLNFGCLTLKMLATRHQQDLYGSVCFQVRGLAGGPPC